MFEIYRDENNELHFSGEISPKISIQNKTPESIFNQIMKKLNDDHDNRNIPKENKVSTEVLNELNNKGSELRKYFLTEIEEKFEAAQILNVQNININIPFKNNMNLEEKRAVESENNILNEQGNGNLRRGVY